MNEHITFVGGGNMTTAIIAGLVKNHYPANKITVCDRNENKRDFLKTQYQVNATDDILKACEKAEVIILAVKPQSIKFVCEQIKTIVINNKTLIISVAAGIKINAYEKWLNTDTAIIRTMPNTPSELGFGATGIFANQKTSEKQKEIADKLMQAIGITSWTDNESILETIMVVSGCGPAYFFYITEQISNIATNMGLEKNESEKLAIQTLLGAAKMAHHSNRDLTTLRQQVSSPGGATEKAIKTFESNGMKTLLMSAMGNAKKRAEELANALGE